MSGEVGKSTTCLGETIPSLLNQGYLLISPVEQRVSWENMRATRLAISSSTHFLDIKSQGPDQLAITLKESYVIKCTDGVIE